MMNKQNLVQNWNPRLRNPMLKVESIVAFRECWLGRPRASGVGRGGHTCRWGRLRRPSPLARMLCRGKA